MTEQPFPTQDDFWSRMDRRSLEPDLRATLRERAARDAGKVVRLPHGDTLVAVIDRILPGSGVPATVLAAFVDANFDRQLGRGDESDGALPREAMIPAGLVALEGASRHPFHHLATIEQDDLLRRAEHGDIPGPQGFDSAAWFRRLRDLVTLGFGSDPRGMTQMGFPGPSYMPGYLWLGATGTQARRARKPGYERY